MQFKLVSQYRYWWPVVVTMPDTDSPGKFIRQKLKILFEDQGQDAALDAQEFYQGLTSARERVDHEREQLLAVVKGWEDVVDEDGSPIAFTQAHFIRALQQTWFRVAVYNAHAESLLGKEPQLGN